MRPGLALYAPELIVVIPFVTRYIACIQAFVQQKADVALFEKYFLDDLAVLSDDLLDVRIMVAKCLGPICARGELTPFCVISAG